MIINPLHLSESDVDSVVKPPQPDAGDLVTAVLARLDTNQCVRVEQHLKALGIAPERQKDFLADVIGMIATALDTRSGKVSFAPDP